MIKKCHSLKNMMPFNDSMSLFQYSEKVTQTLLGAKGFMSGKINDLSNSALRKKFFSNEFVPENNLAIRSIRVSSKKQEQGGSFAEQHEITNEYIKLEKLKIEKTWEVAETASKHELRKHFHEMIAFIKISQKTSRPIKHLLFSHQSRSNRNKKSARELEELVEMGITLHFARDKRKLNPNSDIGGWMMWLLENMKNESYSNELRQNVMGGIIKVIEAGRYPGTKPPFGLIAVGRRDKRHFILDGDKANYMRAAFEIVSSGQYVQQRMSDGQLKEKLDAMFPQLDKTPGKKKFCELLRDPFYTGEEFDYDGGRYKAGLGVIEPIVDRASFNHVQDILNKRTRGRRLSKAHPYIGLMTCQGRILDDAGNVTEKICGASVTAEQIRKTYRNGTAKSFNYYRCSNQSSKCSQRDKTYMKAVAGRNVSYTQDEIEKIFADIFKSFSFDEVTCQRMKQYLWDEHFEAKSTNTARLSELQARQVQLKQFIETAYEDKLCGKISEELWAENTQRWELEREQILGELRSLNDSTDEYMQRGVQLIELIQHAEIIFKNATPEKKRKMVELVSSNLLLANGNLEYHWRKPFNLLAIKGDLKNWLRWRDSNPRPGD